MSSLSILSGDFEILFDDETVGTNAVAGMRMVRRATGASDTIYTTRQLYSAIAEVTDEFLAMGFRNPMLPTTPNAFTMENYYFIPRSSIEYLKEGAITADWTLDGADPDSNGNGVIRKEYTVASGDSDFVSGDIGRQITESASGDTGTLLDYETEPDGTKVAWIRPDDSTPTTGDIFDSTSGTISVTGDSGTGRGTVTTAGNSGESQYTAIQVIGSVPSATEVYLIQDQNKMTDWEGNFQWWVTDTTVSLGIISILVRVKNADTTIAEGDVEVFSRRYTSLYDNFRLNVIAGGFQALPLASGVDINNTTGYRTMTGSSGSGTFNAGNGIYVGTDWASATARGVLTVGDSGSSPVLEYYLVGDLTDFTSGTLKEYDFTTEADGDGTCTVGSPGINDGGPTDTDSGEGGTVTVTLGWNTVDHDGNGTDENYLIEVDCQGPGASGVPIAKVYERLKYICRRGATATDLFGVSYDIPGETYRGVEGIFEYDAGSAFTEGDDVTITGGDAGAKPSFSARCIANNTTDDYVALTDIQTSLQAVADNDVLEDESVNNVTVTTTGVGLDTFTSPKVSPLGTFTGTQIFGARGVAFINPHDDDTQAYILTDAEGTLRNPPNTVTFAVTNTVAGDRVFVARDTGTDGVIDKDQFGGMTVTAASATSITVGGSIDSEVPDSGYLRVVATDEQQEHKYHYASRTTGASGVFTLTPITPGQADSGTSTTALVDAAGDFVNEGVVPGMLIQDTTNGDTYEVVTVTDANNLVIQQVFGTGGSFASGDNYTINETIQAYDTDDDLYDLILDVEATGTTTSNTFIKQLGSNFDVVVNVRNGKTILPFTQNQEVNNSGASVTVVRTPDTIAV